MTIPTQLGPVLDRPRQADANPMARDTLDALALIGAAGALAATVAALTALAG